MVFDCPEVLKGGGSLDNGEEEMEVVALTSLRASKVHATNGKAFLARGPLLGLLGVDPLLRELLIGGETGLRILRVGIKEGSESGLLVGRALSNISKLLSSMEEDKMLV